MANVIQDKKTFISLLLQKLKKVSDEKEAMAFLVSSLQSIEDCHTLRDINANTIAHLLTMKHDFRNLSLAVRAYQEILINQRNKEELFYKWMILENDSQNTVFEIISEHPQKEIMKFLFDIIKDRHDICYCLLINRMNVFHYAVHSGNVYSLIFFYEKLKPLFKSNNILNYSTAELSTPLHLACTQKNSRMIDLLIQLGCNIDSVDKARNTPLLCAVNVNSVGVVKKLLMNGASTHLKSSENKTALELAKERNYQALVTLLEPKSFFDRIFKCKIEYSPHNKSSTLLWIYFLFFITLASKALMILLFPTLKQSNYIKPFIQCPFDKEHCLIDRIIFLIGVIVDCTSCLLVVVFNNFAKRFYSKQFDKKGKKKKKKNKSLIKILDSNENVILCPVCCKMKDRDTLHCIVCNCCVEKWDHHCHWLERCVNDYNLRLFNAITYCAVVELLINWVLTFEGLLIFAFQKLSNPVNTGVFMKSNSHVIMIIRIFMSIVFILLLLFLTVILGSLSYIIYMNHLLKSQAKPQIKGEQLLIEG